jgi:hypothetical protein
MAHYAFLDENNIVTEVITGRNEDEIVDGISDWEAHYSEFRGQVCKRTSYNTNGNVHANGGTPFRYNYAGIGYIFDETVAPDGAFIAPKENYSASWVLNTEKYIWEAPTPKPVKEGFHYYWDETTVSWIETTITNN